MTDDVSSKVKYSEWKTALLGNKKLTKFTFGELQGLVKDQPKDWADKLIRLHAEQMRRRNAGKKGPTFEAQEVEVPQQYLVIDKPIETTKQIDITSSPVQTTCCEKRTASESESNEVTWTEIILETASFILGFILGWLLIRYSTKLAEYLMCSCVSGA